MIKHRTSVYLSEELLSDSAELMEKYKITRSALLSQCVKYFKSLPEAEQFKILTDQTRGMRKLWTK